MPRLILIFASFTISAALFDTYPVLNGDMHAYLPMAADPFTFQSSPYSYRIAMPYIVNVAARITGVEISIAFAGVHFAFACANGFLLARWLDLKGLPTSLSTAFVVVYYFTLPGVFQSSSWGFVDAAFYTFLLMGLIAIERGHLTALCTIVFAGVLFKENIALLVPYYAVHVWAREGVWLAIRRSIPVAAAFAIPFIFLRTGVLFRNPPGANAYGAFYRPEYFGNVLSYWGGPKQILGNVFSPYMTLWIIAAGQVINSWRKNMDELLLIMLAFAQIPFATDVDRMLITAFPAIYVLAGRYIMTCSVAVTAVALTTPIALQWAFWAGIFYRELVLIALAITISAIARRAMLHA